MGIIKAATGSVSGVLADQWLETYSSDGFPQGILAVRGVKKASARSGNTKGEENVISDGSVIIVNHGQCALAIDKGQVIGCYDTPGENIFHSSRTGSIFHRGGLKAIAKQSFERFGYGGVAAVYQVIMYIDMKEHMSNPFSFRLPVNLTERNTGASIDAVISVNGMFSFRITDPAVFYKKVCGCSTGTVRVADILPQITAEFNNIMTIAVSSRFSEGVSAYLLSVSADEIAAAAAEQIDEKWFGLRGFRIASVGIESIGISARDKDLLQSLQYAKALTNPKLAAATLASAQAQAMMSAAKNTN